MRLFNWLPRCMAVLGFSLLAFGGSLPVVYAQSVSRLQLVPSSISGGSGAASTGIVTLTSAAPAGGVVVKLESSNFQLATTFPQITVPAGQTSANFTVATNAKYRRYSGLAFTAAISAVAAQGGTPLSATLNVSAQARPGDVVINPRPDRSGPVCVGDSGLLFDCPLSNGSQNGQCTFRQECTLGCEDQPTQGTSWRDVCATTGPVPLALNPQRLIGGASGGGALQLSAAAPAGSTGLVASASLVAAEPSRVNIPIPVGAVSHPFILRTAPVNQIEFAPIDGVVTTPRAINGTTFFQGRRALSWLPVTPGLAPAPRLISLALESTSVLGGEVTFGTTCIDQLAPAPAIGSVTLAITSSTTAASIIGPASTALVQGSDCRSFSVQTSPVAADTLTNIQVQLGAQVLSAALQVRATPAASQANSLFFDPSMLNGGQNTQGLVVLNGRAPPNGFLVTLSTDQPAAIVLPASVTVPAGADRASFTVATKATGADLQVNIMAGPSSSVLVSQLFILATAGSPSLTSIAVSPARVTGGSSSTATVTLSGPALSSGTVVNLSSNSSAAAVPASVSVPSGSTSAQFAVATVAVSVDTLATLSATLGGTANTSVTQITSLTVTPATTPTPGVLAAPSLLSPASDARLAVSQPVNFDWSDVSGAASYVLQVDSASDFAAPLTLNLSVTASQHTVSLAVSRPYWRVRAIDASGNPGTWSTVRNFRVQ